MLICDEPVSSLDVSVRAQVLNLLVSLRERLGLTYLYISHDLASVRFISDRIAVMYLGRMVEVAPVEALFAHPLHHYTHALLQAIPVPDPSAPAAPVLGELPSAMERPSGCVSAPAVRPPRRVARRRSRRWSRRARIGWWRAIIRGEAGSHRHGRSRSPSRKRER